MSTYPGPDDSQRFGAEPQRSGMSSGTKWLLGLGIGCGVVVLLCCGGVGVVTFTTMKSVQEGATEDPAKVAEIADGITSIDIPADLRPTGGLDFVMPFTDMHLFTVAVFTGDANEGTLFLAGSPADLEQTDQKALEKEMTEKMSGQQEGPGQMVVRESRPLQLTIRGKPANFVIQKGEMSGHAKDQAVKPVEKPPVKPPEKPDAPQQPGAPQQMVGAVGMFQGKQGASLIVIQLDAARYTEADVEKILRSIQ